jgi:hypothetical protein
MTPENKLREALIWYDSLEGSKGPHVAEMAKASRLVLAARSAPVTDNDKLSEAIEAVEFAQPHTADSSLGIVLGAAWQVLAARSAPSAVEAALAVYEGRYDRKPDETDYVWMAHALFAAALHSQPQEPDALRGALRDIVEFCDDPHGSEHHETLAVGLSRMLPAARAALSSHATESAAMPAGLDIKFGDDGTWLNLASKEPKLHASIRLESIAERSGHIIGSAINQWCKEARAGATESASLRQDAVTEEMIEAAIATMPWFLGVCTAPKGTSVREVVRRALEAALRAPAPARPTREEIIDLLAKSRGVMPHEYLADAILALWGTK